MILVLARVRFVLAAILGAGGMVIVSAPLLAAPAAADKGDDVSTVTSTAPATGDQLDVLHPRHGDDTRDADDGDHHGRHRRGRGDEAGDPVLNVDPSDLPIVGPLVDKVTPTVAPRHDPAPSPSLPPEHPSKPTTSDDHAEKHAKKPATASAKATRFATPHPAAPTATASHDAGPSTQAPPAAATHRRGPRVVDVAAVRPLRGTTSTLVRDAASRRGSSIVFAVLATATAIAAFLLLPGAPAWIAPHRARGSRSRRRRGVAIAAAGGVRPRPGHH